MLCSTAQCLVAIAQVCDNFAQYFVMYYCTVTHTYLLLPNLTFPAVVPPLIYKGIPKPPFVDFPPYIGPESCSFKIGSNDFLLEGQSFTISCSIIGGDPAPYVMWSKNGVNLPQYVNRSTITVPTGPSSDSSMAEGAGAYTCTATNPAGTDMATSRMRAGIGW